MIRWNIQAGGQIVLAIIQPATAATPKVHAQRHPQTLSTRHGARNADKDVRRLDKSARAHTHMNARIKRHTNECLHERNGVSGFTLARCPPPPAVRKLADDENLIQCQGMDVYR